ncbi:MAG: ATP-dependent Clp protease ATP-binding subunit, partial [bacterium]|nr:ATP-dependent Clp protease ATP-binding subunit [bacterium]
LGMTRPAHDGTGRRVPTVTPADHHDVIEDRVVDEIRRHFTEELNRPELLNRVGDNLVVFDFIRKPAAIQITDLMLERIKARVRDSAGIEVDISSSAREQLHRLTTADLSFGGRGIGNVLEARYVNPLARALFAHDPPPGVGMEVVEVASTGVPQVVLR